MVITQQLNFKEPAIADAAWAVPVLSVGDMKNCEFSFTTIWMWRRYYNNQIARAGDSIFIRSGDTEPLYLLPVGGDLRENIRFLREYQHSRNETLLLFGADEPTRNRIEEWFPGVFEWEPSVADFDYLYHTEDLALLNGRKFHGKRNHIASFEAKYNWSYETIGADNAEEVFAMVTQWCHQKGNCSDPGLRHERQSIGEALKSMKDLSIQGGLLRVDGKIVAMTMGSPISNEIFDIHTEKAFSEYDGAYAMINREFASRALLGRYPLINRENDMGIEGLRRAKRSYHPVQILEKYLGTEKA